MQDLIKIIEKEQLRTDLPEIQIGDLVKVHVKVIEGARERLQVFEGYVTGRQGGSSTETFTVRKISGGIGVERTFPVNSPRIDKVEIVRHGHVRRAKLHYLRDRAGKAAKIKEKR
ncbi:MAG: 50S ribosomal protein L19 [Christensenellales bacterium]